jgi:hypothetical protein
MTVTRIPGELPRRIAGDPVFGAALLSVGIIGRLQKQAGLKLHITKGP